MALLRSSSYEVEVYSGFILGFLLTYLIINDAIFKTKISFALCMELKEGSQTSGAASQVQERIPSRVVHLTNARIREGWIDPSGGNIACHRNCHNVSYSFHCFQNNIEFEVEVRCLPIPPKVFHSLVSVSVSDKDGNRVVSEEDGNTLEIIIEGETMTKIETEVLYIENNPTKQMLHEVRHHNIRCYQYHRLRYWSVSLLLILLFILFSANDYSYITGLCILLLPLLGLFTSILILRFQLFGCLKENPDVLLTKKI